MGVLVEDVGGFISTNTFLVLGTTLFLSLLPETPSNCVVVIENSGTAPVFTQGSYNLPQIERPELQIIVRNDSYATARSVAETLYRLLTQVVEQTIGGTRYHRIEAISTPSLFQRDDNRRSLISCNFYVMKGLS